MRDQERQEWCVDIRVAVYDEVRAGQQDHCRMQTERPPLHLRRMRSLRETSVTASLNSWTRRRYAEAARTAIAAAMVVPSRMSWGTSPMPGNHRPAPMSTATAAIPMIA